MKAQHRFSKYSLLTLILLFFILSSPAPSSAGKVGFILDDVVNPIDIAAYLAWVKQTMPDLYANTKDYAVDFWATVREQNELQKNYLQRFPEYKKYVTEKKELLRFVIQARLENKREYEVDRFVKDASLTAKDFKTVADIQKTKAAVYTALGKGSSQSFGELLRFLPAGQKDQFKDSIKMGKLEPLLDFFEKNGGIPQAFNGKNVDLSPPYTKAQLLKRFHDLSSGENQIKNYLLAQFYKENEKTFAQGTESDAITLFKSTSGELKNILSARYRLELTSSDQDYIVLVELPISKAILKETVGIVCTPGRFANAITERTFLVFNAKDLKRPKAYLTVTLASESGQTKTLLKAMNGEELSPTFVDVILMKAPELAYALKTAGPIMEKSAITNYDQVSAGFRKYGNSQAPVAVTFLDERMRSVLDIEEDDPGGLHHSESMNRIKEACAYRYPDPEVSNLYPTYWSYVPIESITLPTPSALNSLR